MIFPANPDYLPVVAINFAFSRGWHRRLCVLVSVVKIKSELDEICQGPNNSEYKVDEKKYKLKFQKSLDWRVGDIAPFEGKKSNLGESSLPLTIKSECKKIANLSSSSGFMEVGHVHTTEQNSHRSLYKKLMCFVEKNFDVFGPYRHLMENRREYGKWMCIIVKK